MTGQSTPPAQPARRALVAERIWSDGRFQPRSGGHHRRWTHRAHRGARTSCRRDLPVERFPRRLLLPGTLNAHNHSFQSHAARHRRRLRLLHLARPRALRLHPAHGRGGGLPRRALRLRRDDAQRRHHRLRLLLHPPRRQRERPRRHPRRARPRHAHRPGAARCTTGTARRREYQETIDEAVGAHARAVAGVSRRATMCTSARAALAARRQPGDDPGGLAAGRGAGHALPHPRRRGTLRARHHPRAVRPDADALAGIAGPGAGAHDDHPRLLAGGRRHSA